MSLDAARIIACATRVTKFAGVFIVNMPLIVVPEYRGRVGPNGIFVARLLQDGLNSRGDARRIGTMLRALRFYCRAQQRHGNSQSIHTVSDAMH